MKLTAVSDAILKKWGSSSLWQWTMPNDAAYPDTDQQYQQYQSYDPALWAQYYQQTAYDYSQYYNPTGDSSVTTTNVEATNDQSNNSTYISTAQSIETPAVDSTTTDSNKRSAESEALNTKELAKMINLKAKKQKTEKTTEMESKNHAS